jgi:hypothetical protein
MPTLPKDRSNSLETSDARCFGLRIESQLLQLAIATRGEDGRYCLDIDQIHCSETTGWLTPSGFPLLVDALRSLADRHQMRNGRVAMSLDGHYCVTRVTMGTAEEVDTELEMQAGRVPRYLQLGPGEKVTGSSRQRISNSIDYAVTGVVNRSIIQLLYDAIREAELNATWIEPSLVSVARMLGQAQVGGDTPVMIADGTGSQWDVGIACSGRLLLDYRPAGATDAQGLRQALDGHITRLKRFCLRHRGIATGEMNRLMICGSGDKPAHAIEVLGNSLGIEPEILRVPNLTNLYELDREKRQSRSVPAVATVLPLLIGVPESEVPDLLTEVRRAPDLPLLTRLVQTAWPAVAAIIILVTCFGLLSRERARHAGAAAHDELVSRIAAADAQFRQVSSKQAWLGHLNQIQRQTHEPVWLDMLDQIAQSLPDYARLDAFRVEASGHILIEGSVLEESLIYEIVENVRRIPGISQAALTGTTPDESIGGTRFSIRLEPLGRDSAAENFEDWDNPDA